MDQARWVRVQQLFLGALDQPVEEREGFLRRSEADPAIQARAEQLPGEGETLLREALATLRNRLGESHDYTVQIAAGLRSPQ